MSLETTTFQLCVAMISSSLIPPALIAYKRLQSVINLASGRMPQIYRILGEFVYASAPNAFLEAGCNLRLNPHHLILLVVFANAWFSGDTFWVYVCL